MAEWTKAPVLKTGVPQGTVGSNPTPSAKRRMPYYAYILKSESDGSFYKGSCEDLAVRFASHSAGKVKSTKSRRPWRLHYSEEFATRTEAIKREKFFKSRSGYRWLRAKGLT